MPSTSILPLVAWATLSTGAPAEPSSDDEVAVEPEVEAEAAPEPDEERVASVPPEGVEPIEGRSAIWVTTSDGHVHFERHPGPEDGPETDVQPERPLGMGPKEVYEPFDPTKPRLLRLDLLFGVAWRLEPINVALSTSAEYGRMQGFSGSFHTGLHVSPDRNVVRVIDAPIGLGAVYRHRFGKRPLYGSVGLSGGILIHRADTDTEQGVIHRVDPDLRLPLRLAWTIQGVGVSVAVVPAYSVRERSYERRGARVWNHHSVRIGLLFGLHWDIVRDRPRLPRSQRRRNG